jgi:hypothetical protein
VQLQGLAPLNCLDDAEPDGGQHTDLYHSAENARREVANDGPLRAAVAVLLVKLGPNDRTDDFRDHILFPC